jgi:ATP-dependent Clp protease ATP-binding subunit ClpC
MYELFTDRARATVTGAEGHARRLGHTWVGTEHLLLGLSDGDGVAARALSQVGFDGASFEQAVVDQVGRDHLAGSTQIPFTPRIKKALEASLRQALTMGHNYIGTEHLVLGLLEDDSSLATKLVADQGITATTVQAAVIDLLAGMKPTSEQAWPAPASADRTGPADPFLAAAPDADTARCPGCRQPLAPNLGADVMPSVGELDQTFTVAYCRACGHVLAVLPED